MISGGAHEIKIAKVAPEGILGDFKDMRSAVTNLVTNAVRYTPKDGKIELSWEVKDDHGILSVKDNGIGIAPEHIPRVTERFYRVDKSRSQRDRRNRPRTCHREACFVPSPGSAPDRV